MTDNTNTQLTLLNKEDLLKAYIPFVKNGGFYLANSNNYVMEDTLKVELKLMEETEYTLDTYEINGVQIWCPDRDRFNTKKHIKNDPLMKYVHQLQNRYFSLTGEELTIKQ